MDSNEEMYWGMNSRTYCMVIHLSQLSSFVIPGLGLLLPVVLWIAHKDQNERIDQHGRVTANWLLSLVLYSIICTVLAFVLIGFVGFAILGILNIVFAIVAAIKANNDELWVYPLSIRFFKR